MANKELGTLVIQRRVFFKMARDAAEYLKNIVPSDGLIQQLHKKGVDIFTFLERKWCYTVPNPPKSWAKTNDNVALIQITKYDNWLKIIGKKTRNMIRKAEKNGVRTEVVKPNQKLAEDIWKIYNETPIRQERGFPHYGIDLQIVTKIVFSQQDCTYIGAYLQDELAGFIQLVHGDKIVIISQILSLQKYLDKAVNNALVAKAIEYCASRNILWVMYGRMGNHPTLDSFKQNNGFHQELLTRYYIPLTRKGKIVIKLGLHKEIKDSLPQSMKYPLIPLYNWISRTKTKMKLYSRDKRTT
jgi:hypothetical protein